MDSYVELTNKPGLMTWDQSWRQNIIKRAVRLTLWYVVLSEMSENGGHLTHLIDATATPKILFTTGSSSEKYLAICVDPDGPYPSFTVLSPILHWIQSGLEVSSSTGLLATNDPPVANYVGPGPPPGSSPHRYIFLLYEQPAGFDYRGFVPPEGKPLGTMARLRWDITT